MPFKVQAVESGLNGFRLTGNNIYVPDLKHLKAMMVKLYHCFMMHTDHLCACVGALCFDFYH